MSKIIKIIEAEIKTFSPRWVLESLKFIRFFYWKFIWAVRGKILTQKYFNIPDEKNNYWINPDKIIYRTLNEFDVHPFMGKVLDGDWDLLEKKFEDSLFYVSFRERLKTKREWSELKYYQNLVDRISKGEICWGCRTKEDADKRCRKLDAIYKDIKNNGYNPSKYGDEITVNVGRHGDLLFNNGRHRLAFCKILRIQKIPVKIVVRHSKWVKFRNEIISYTQKEGGKIYSPITHIDLQYITSHYSDKRFNIIKNNISTKKGTLLDIGSNWGYFCHKFEEKGFRCYSIENDPMNLYFLKKLKRAENRQFHIVSESIFTFCNHMKRRKFDVVLALAVFHHFLKKKETYIKLIELLENLEIKELFFQPHKPYEPQMKGAYKNFNYDEFTEFILNNSCLTKSKKIGIGDDGRPIYKLNK